MTSIQIAEVCHEANRAYCATIGDRSQKSWSDADAWQRKSAVQGVEFRLNHPQAKVDTQHNAWYAAQHNAWYADKIRDGWKFGPIKDPEKKEHPCLVPYSSLPTEQQMKDALFCAIVDALK